MAAIHSAGGVTSKTKNYLGAPERKSHTDKSHHYQAAHKDSHMILDHGAGWVELFIFSHGFPQL